MKNESNQVNASVMTQDISGSKQSKSAVTTKVTSSHEPQHWDKPFWRSVVSSEFGVGSTSRIAALSTVGASLGIVIYLVIRTGTIPDHLAELGFFAALLITSVYSPAKVAEILKLRAGKR